MTQQKPSLDLDAILGRCDPELVTYRRRAVCEVVDFLLRSKPFTFKTYTFPLHSEVAWDHYGELIHKYPDFYQRVTALLSSHLGEGMDTCLSISEADNTTNLYGYFCLDVFPAATLALTRKEKKLIASWDKAWKPSR